MVVCEAAFSLRKQIRDIPESAQMLEFADGADVTSVTGGEVEGDGSGPSQPSRQARRYGVYRRRSSRLLFFLLQVLHDGRRVGTLLTQRYGVNMRNVFDTQVCLSKLAAVQT